MSKIQIITDSASDISKEMEQKYNLDVISYSIVIGDKTYTSRVDFDNEGCYELMEASESLPMTSQITAFQFMELYYDYYQKGCTDLIFILINGKGSATYNNSLMAMDMLIEEHPECEGKIHIYSHDGGSYSAGYGQPAVMAAKMAQEGRSVEEINTYLEESIARRRIYFGIYNLKYAGKSGRIPSAAAFIGDKIGIKPMEPGSEYQIEYGNDEKIKEEMAAKMTEKLGYGPTGYFQIGAEVAANAGPRIVGVAFDVKK